MNTLTSSNWQTSQQANWQNVQNQRNQLTSATASLSQAFGKTFLEQVAQVVSSNESAKEQKMQDRKAEYSTKKKTKDLEDERIALLGRVNLLSQKYS